MKHRNLNHSVLDQALLSAFNLGINLLLVMKTSADVYGTFVVFQAVVFLLLAAQGALILTPLNILLPGRSERVVERQKQSLETFNIAFVLLGFAVAFVAGLVYGASLLQMIAVAFFASMSVFREYWRSVHFVTGESASALKLDFLFVLIALVATGCLWLSTDPLTACLGGLAIGNTLSVLAFTPVLRMRPAPLVQAISTYRPVLKDSLWAFAGASQTEVQMRGYVLIVEAWRGVAALGALQASRFIAAPIHLVAIAWARVTRPRMVNAIHQGDDPTALKAMFGGFGFMLLVCLLHGVTLLLLWPFIEGFVFGDRYPDVGFILGLWWAHTSLLAINTVPATLLQARRCFRQLTLIGTSTAVVTILGLLALSMTALETHLVLYLLIGVEIMGLAIQGWILLKPSDQIAEVKLV